MKERLVACLGNAALVPPPSVDAPSVPVPGAALVVLVVADAGPSWPVLAGLG